MILRHKVTNRLFVGRRKRKGHNGQRVSLHQTPPQPTTNGSEANGGLCLVLAVLVFVAALAALRWVL